jgi:protein-disulfide isomerase
MHDRMYESRGLPGPGDLVGYALDLGLDSERVAAEIAEGVHAARVQRDVDSGLASGVAATPTFFVNGRLHDASFDAGTLVSALEGSQRR